MQWSFASSISIAKFVIGSYGHNSMTGADITTLFSTRHTLIYLLTTTTQRGKFCGSTHYLGVRLVGMITFCGMRLTKFLVLLQKSHQE